MINIWASPPCKILGTFLKENKGRTSTNRRENKKTNDNALHPRDDLDYVCLEKKDGRGLVSIEDSIDSSIQ